MTKYQIVRRIVSVTIVAGFLGWAGWYVYSNAESFSQLAEVSWTDGAILISAFLTIMVCNGIFISIVTEAFKIRLHSQEWLSLSFASSFANYFLPFKGGAGMRALYMNRLHGFPITEFVSTLSIMYLMHIVVNGVLALIGMMLIVANEGPANISLLIFFAVISLFGILGNGDRYQDWNRLPEIPYGTVFSPARRLAKSASKSITRIQTLGANVGVVFGNGLAMSCRLQCSFGIVALGGGNRIRGVQEPGWACGSYAGLTGYSGIDEHLSGQRPWLWHRGCTRRSGTHSCRCGSCLIVGWSCRVDLPAPSTSKCVSQCLRPVNCMILVARLNDS